jgi:ribose 5-phosphate isomerase A
MQQLKRLAAERAADSIQPGMVVGLGSGSTAAFVVHRLAALRAEGQLTDVVGVPTSVETEALARSLGVPLTTLEEHPVVDLTIDGAAPSSARRNWPRGWRPGPESWRMDCSSA